MRKLYASVVFIAVLLMGQALHAQNAKQPPLRQVIKQNAVQLKLDAYDAENAIVSHSFTDEKTNLQYVYLQQTYQQVKVFNSIKTIVMKNNEVLYTSGSFVTLADAGNLAATPSIGADIAVANAAQHLKLPAPSLLMNVENKFATEKKITFSAAGIAKSDIKTELVWVAAEDGKSLKLAWDVSIDVLGSADWWNVRIDATTGAYIEKNNWTVHERTNNVSDAINEAGFPVTTVSDQIPSAKTGNGTNTWSPPTVTSAGYYVSPMPAESPRTSPAMTTVTQPWLRAGAGNNAITNGWHFDGTTNYDITRGNNVHAYLDVANTNNPASAGNAPVVTSTTANPALTFNFVPDFTQQPSVNINKQAAVTNLFYWNNTIHDVLYQYGFNEASGNFQTDNMGRGGAGNDYVQAEAQDGFTTDNANFSTQADGTRPRMQMFLWSGVPVFTVNTPSNVAGNYFATESGFSANNKLVNVGTKTGPVVWYNDDASPNPTHYACNGSTPGSLTGKIVLIIRGGGCAGGFVEKVKNAQLNGAIAVIVINNVAGFPITMGGTDNTITIPAVMISQADGALLAAEVANNLNITLAPGITLDGDFDNGIISHEYGHGVSNRLTGGAPNASCLSNAEQGGEGWSDYIALMLCTNWSTAAVSNGNLPRPVGIYAVGQPLNGTGLRTYPYSTDMSINPHTYANVANPTYAGEVHYIGEIWTAAVWDMTWFIIQQENSINPNIYDGGVSGGNSIAFKLVMEGMRLQSCRPGFLDARNAILAADSILYNNRHKCAIWKAFARRGMGLSAVQGSSNNTTDQVAAFDVPSQVVLNKQTTPLTVAQGEQVNVKLTATCDCQINSNYTLRDTIPAGFTYVSSNGGTLAGNVVTFSNLSFAAEQETKAFNIVLQPNVAGCAITTSINDNRDGSTTGGMASVVATGATNWVTSTTRSSSPTTSWFAASNNTNRDFSLTSAAFTAGNLSVFSFKHYFITKNTIEGGRVEYSTDGGTTWVDAQKFIIQNGYNNTSSVATPWGVGNKMFGGVSYGRGSGQFIQTVVDLSSLSGQSVRVRLRSRGTTSNLGTYEGWYVDDILQMDGCGGIVKAGLYDGTGSRVDSLASPLFIRAAVTAVSITSQPASITVCNGATATFSVTADPASLPTYQWQLSTNNGGTWNDIAAATAASYTTGATTLAMSGYQYRVVVTSGVTSGFVISNAATLTVNPIPTVNTVSNQSLCPGATTTAVNFTGAVTGTVYNWTNNNTSIGLAASGVGNIAPFTAVNTSNTAQVATITVTPSYTNAGTTCTGTPVSFTITVTPNPAITIVADPGTTLCAGDPTRLTVYELGAPVPVTVTQSGSNAITALNSISCNNGIGHAENSYWRAINLTPLGLAGPFTINTVNFGIEQASGGVQPVTVKLYTQTGAAFPGGTRTLIASQTYNVPNQAGTIFAANLSTPVTVAANATIVMEINTPDGQATGRLLFIGSNTAAQSGPSYITAATCGVATPTDLAAIGFPGMHIVMNMQGTVPGAGGMITTGTFLWTPAAGLSSTTTNPVAASPAVTTTYTVTTTTPLPAGCTRQASITITVNQRPAISTQPLPTTVCAGAAATFTAVGTGTGATLQWQQSTDGGLNWTNLTNTAPYSGVTTGTLTINPTTFAMNGYRYRLSVSGTCPPVAFSNGAILTVNALPVVTITPAGPTCGGVAGTNGTLLTASSPTGGNFTWSPATGLYTNATATTAYVAGTPTATVYAAPATNTTYTVSATNGTTGCVGTGTVTVNYTPPAPTVTPAAATICLGSVQQLTITSSLAPVTVTGASGPISVLVPDGTGDAALSSVTIGGIPVNAVISNVTVKFTMTHTWVGDMDINLVAPNLARLNLVGGLDGGTGSNGTANFTNTTFSSAGGAVISGAPAPRSNTFAAEARAGYGPTGYEQTVNNWNALLTVPNGTWTLAMGDFGGGDAGTLTSWNIDITYGLPAGGIWSPATGLYTNPAATTPYVAGTPAVTVYASPAATTTYSVTVANGTCPSPARLVTVTVNTPLAITAQPVNTTVCTDKVATFSVAATGTGQVHNWQVSTDAGNTFTNITNGGVYSGANTATLTITAPPVSMNGYLYRDSIATAPCPSLKSANARLTVNPLPTVVISAAPYTSLYPGLVTTLTSTVTPNAAAIYTWLRNGAVVPGATGASLSVNVDGLGLYTLRVQDVNGCVGTSNAIRITDSSVGKLFIYPNPNNGIFQVRYYSANANVLVRGITVYDAQGSRVMVQNFTNTAPYSRMDVDLTKYGKGIYWIELGDRSGNRLAVGRVIVQ